MNNRFIEQARVLCAGIGMAMLMGGLAACTDDYDLDDPGNYPDWLGESIYDALKNPQALSNDGQEVLTGTFSNYLRLIDDLGYAETLGKTGSKTVFAANDEAFNRFYASNLWGVSSYEDLTEAMKKQLLYGSMLDNAILVEMLSNVSDGATSVTQGQALKHQTTLNVIDTITLLKGKADMPVNNRYWEKYYDTGIHLVNDNTRPLMVHFTEQQMTGNGITTRDSAGVPSDFHVLTGTPYDAAEKSAYIYRNKIIKQDVTCKNGYIHQMQDVLVPPGNLAQLIRNNGKSSLFSRMLDRFSAPYTDAATTKSYNDYAQVNGLPLIDNIYFLHYWSQNSQRARLADDDTDTDPNGNDAPAQLDFDPGWNAYSSGSVAVADMAAMFVPTDDAMWDFFQPGGAGAFIIEQFGKQPNERQHLAENIDSITLQPVQQLINNLMKPSFVNSVPSKFGIVLDKANDPMGITLDDLDRNADGTYNVQIANNGVAYMLNTVFAPPALVAVSAPVSLNSNMRVMNEAVNDGHEGHSQFSLSQNFYAYLLAMSANYAFFIPTDEAFANYYVDPASLTETDDNPRALKFYPEATTADQFAIKCSAWRYDKATGAVGTDSSALALSGVRSQMIDILNYHTVVLKNGEELGSNGNRFYKTKHGGAIMFENGTVKSGGQIDGHMPASAVTKVYPQKNGKSYVIDHLIQPPLQSVLGVLKADSTRFSEFLQLCTDYDMDAIMAFASDWLAGEMYDNGPLRMSNYHPFASKKGLTDNVNYFSSYNYTVYAPDNTAMKLAYDRGLPRWSDIKVLYDAYNDTLQALKKDKAAIPEEVQQARNKALAMVEEINNFVRYHFQDNSVYADQVVETGTYPTACIDTLGIRQKLTVTQNEPQKFTVTDDNGQQIVIDANSKDKVVNAMTRDYVLNASARSISTSSFAVVHQVSTPLSTHAGTTRYDGAWTGANARQRMAAYRKQFEQRLYKRYDGILKN